jgi:hypothetical protein
MANVTKRLEQKAEYVGSTAGMGTECPRRFYPGCLARMVFLNHTSIMCFS